MSNETLDTIRTRSSIRAFLPELPTPEQIDQLKQAALAAPTAHNRQENRFVFVTDKDIIDEISTRSLEVIKETEPEFYQRFITHRGDQGIFYGAPLVVVIYSEDVGYYAELDAGIAVQTLALASKSLGLDSCINGISRKAFGTAGSGKLKQRLGMTERDRFRLSIAIGRRAAGKEPHETDMAHIIDL